MKRPFLNRLDIILIAIIVALLSWLYLRSSIGVNYHWRWYEAVELIFVSSSNGNLPYFFQGLISTVRISLFGILFAFALGIIIGVARHSKLSFFRIPAGVFVHLIRNIPPLVFIFIFYFFVSSQLVPALGLDSLLRNQTNEISTWQLILFGPSNLWENLLSGVLCVSFLSSAYIAEIVRAGLDGIAKGQWEAADSLGLSNWVKYRYIIAPQVIASITPTLAGQAISLVKDTSIVSLISIQEMTFVGTEIANSSGLIFEIWLIIGLFYFLLCLSLSLAFKALEKKSRHFLKT
jgi:polar amino acid transport system permease protein